MIPPLKRFVPMFAMAGILLNVDAAFGCTVKWKTRVTAMKSDLRSLVTAQAEFVQQHQRYARNIGELEFRKSTGVAAVTIHPTANGFTARATHTQLSGMCVVYVGTRSPGIRAPNRHMQGEPWCAGIPEQAADAVQARRDRALHSAWILLVALTIATRVFLSARGRGNWAFRGLLAVSVLYPVVVLSKGMCSHLPREPLLGLLGLGLLIFTFALRRHVVVPEPGP